MAIETHIPASDDYDVVKTMITIGAPRGTIWSNIKNVKNIRSKEILPHFVHLIGIPKPINGQLKNEGIGGIRSITWNKGIKFPEIIKTWDEGKAFTYDIKVDPESIPPATLDEHVIIVGKYFDVIEGGYKIDSISDVKSLVTLTCKYRVTTNLNFYSKLWAHFILDEFNKMILEVVKSRSERQTTARNMGLQQLGRTE